MKLKEIVACLFGSSSSERSQAFRGLELFETRELLSAAPAAAPMVAAVHAGTNPANGQVVVVADQNWSGTPANISVTLGQDYRGVVTATVDNGQGLVVSAPAWAGVSVANNSNNGTINFVANDMQLTQDNIGPIVLSAPNGSVNFTTTIPVTADGRYVVQGDTGFWNGSSVLTGDTVICVPGGSTLIARSTGGYLVSTGAIGSVLFGQAGTQMYSAGPDSVFYSNSSVWTAPSVVTLGGSNSTVSVYGNGTTEVFGEAGDNRGVTTVNDYSYDTGFTAVYNYGQYMSVNVQNINHGGLFVGGYSSAGTSLNYLFDSNQQLYVDSVAGQVWVNFQTYGGYINGKG